MCVCRQLSPLPWDYLPAGSEPYKKTLNIIIAYLVIVMYLFAIIVLNHLTLLSVCLPNSIPSQGYAPICLPVCPAGWNRFNNHSLALVNAKIRNYFVALAQLLGSILLNQVYINTSFNMNTISKTPLIN